MYKLIFLALSLTTNSVFAGAFASKVMNNCSDSALGIEDLSRRVFRDRVLEMELGPAADRAEVHSGRSSEIVIDKKRYELMRENADEHVFYWHKLKCLHQLLQSELGTQEDYHSLILSEKGRAIIADLKDYLNSATRTNTQATTKDVILKARFDRLYISKALEEIASFGIVTADLDFTLQRGADVQLNRLRNRIDELRRKSTRSYGDRFNQPEVPPAAEAVRERSL